MSFILAIHMQNIRCIFDENIISASKMRNHYGAIQFIYFNFGLFSIAPCYVITLNLLLSFITLFIIALPTIAIEIVVALFTLKGDND